MLADRAGGGAILFIGEAPRLMKGSPPLYLPPISIF